MYLSTKLLENAVQQTQEGLIVDLSLKQLIGLKGVERFLEPDQANKLLLSTNYLPNIDTNFHLFRNLRELDLSINHISSIENLESLENLRLLNLSNNRITKIENLDALKNLEVLDLSMNYIERIQNLKNRSLKTLILAGNNISELENLYYLKQLQNLDIEKNALENINNLTIFGCKDLKKISFAYNKIPVSYFEDLLMLLEAFPNLEDVNFVGNEVTAHKLYRAKLMQFQNIKVLDKLIIKDPIKKHFEAIRQDHEIKDLVEKTKDEYLQRMAAENQLKYQALEMVEKQKKQIEEAFEKHQDDLQEDMQYFFNRAHELQDRKNKGLDQAVTDDILDNWKESVQKKAAERKTALDEAMKKQKLTEKEYLEAQINSKKFTEKLYEISMKNPEVWRDIKQKEKDTYQNEEALAQRVKELNMNQDEIDIKDYQELANQIQIDMMKDVANAVIDYEAKELKEQREKAAYVLKHALLKQMVNHYTAVRKKDKPEDEVNEDYQENNPETEFRDVNTTEDQLKEMLHSRVYRDGEWKTVRKQNPGPRDLSDRSVGELINFEKSKNYPSKMSPTKKKGNSPQRNAIPEEEQNDDDYENRQVSHGLSRRLQQKLRDSQLERDPFEGDGKTYYDDAHVVGEQNGQKVLLIPFENSQVLEGMNTPYQQNQQKKVENETYSPETRQQLEVEVQPGTSILKGKGKKKKKKKKKKVAMSNLLADLDEDDDNNRIENNNNEGKGMSTVDIPEYQLRNRPYMTLGKEADQEQGRNINLQSMENPEYQRENVSSGTQMREPQQNPNKASQNKPKSKHCNIF